jgi:hypothetical protein
MMLLGWMNGDSVELPVLEQAARNKKAKGSAFFIELPMCVLRGGAESAELPMSSAFPCADLRQLHADVDQAGQETAAPDTSATLLLIEHGGNGMLRSLVWCRGGALPGTILD